MPLYTGEPSNRRPDPPKLFTISLPSLHKNTPPRDSILAITKHLAYCFRLQRIRIGTHHPLDGLP